MPRYALDYPRYAKICAKVSSGAKIILKFCGHPCVQRHRDGGCTRRLSHQSHHCHHSEVCSATFAARLVFWGSLFAFVHLALVGFTVTAVVRSLGAAQGLPQVSYNIGPAELPYKVFLTTSNRHSGMVMPLAFTRHSVHGGGSHRASPSHVR